MGRPFMGRTVEPVEAKRLVERVRLRLSAVGPSAQLHEYMLDEYQVLYLVADGATGEPSLVQLLAIKHQKLGFDVPGERWPYVIRQATSLLRLF
jgi:hypothetical protein